MTDRMPPLTVEDVRDALADPSYSVLLYVGAEDDLGWENVEILYGLLPRMRIYLVEDPELVSTWTGGDADVVGLVFGWDATLRSALGLAEVEDLRELLDAVTDAREA